MPKLGVPGINLCESDVEDIPYGPDETAQKILFAHAQKILLEIFAQGVEIDDWLAASRFLKTQSRHYSYYKGPPPPPTELILGNRALQIERVTDQIAWAVMRDVEENKRDVETGDFLFIISHEFLLILMGSRKFRHVPSESELAFSKVLLRRIIPHRWSLCSDQTNSTTQAIQLHKGPLSDNG